jgi:hypothetical protein
MENSKIEQCECLCREFLERAEALRQHEKECNSKTDFRWFVYSPRESGALRRTSMELTRALADLRRAG